jgi:hypothetical protein
LDAALRDRPDWRNCAVLCRHCGIRFFAHPRCAGRRDLHCPFGCRAHHRRQCGNERSKKYRDTDSGRAKKKQLNIAARIKAGQAASSDTTPPTPLEPSNQLADESSSANPLNAAAAVASSSVGALPAIAENLTLPLEGFVLDESTLVNSRILPYVRMLVSVLEGRTISHEELIATLRQGIRQRGIGRLPRREYVLDYLNQHPP